MSTLKHYQNVRLLYKGILRLHRGLPAPMRELGDSYVKDEFQRHKTANEAHTYYFMQEWTKYYVTLSNQIGRDGKKRPLGQKMNDTELEKFTDDQLRQLHDLYVELKSPADDGSTNASKT